MAAVQLHCPHCGGLFQIDETLAGQHVSCPLCLGVVAIPELVPPLAAPPPEFIEPPPAPEEAQQLGCPVCGGVFQVTRDMAGMQVSCPHCSTAVLLPEAPSPPAVGASAAWSDATAGLETPPPLFQEPAAATAPPIVETTPAAPRPPVDPFSSSVAATKPAEKDVEDLLPPAAEKPDAPVVEHDAEAPRADDERAARRQAAAPTKPVLIPTEDGAYIALHEPVKKVAAGGREIELRRLSPEEKERRRFRRNLVVAGLGLFLLIVAMLVMGLRGGF
jgi:DNA-directed RNA polymerase subunit RPC12/RpoP